MSNESLGGDANGGRINVSVATLRAELASLELRIYQRFQEALALKAEIEYVKLIETHVERLEERERQNELALKTVHVSSDQVDKYKKWLVATSVSLVSLLIASIALLEHIYG